MDFYRYLIEHNNLYKKDDGLAESLLRRLVQLDPSCPEGVQLAEVLLAKGMHTVSFYVTISNLCGWCKNFLGHAHYVRYGTRCETCLKGRMVSHLMSNI